MTIEIPGYKILRELGRGGMATVYLAIQESFGREVALKVMAPHLAAEPEFANRFTSEARMVAVLSHPHIVTVYDVGHHQNYHYMAMEYHTGGDLGTRIERGEVTPTEALRITRQLADALSLAHSKGVVHRDIKPDNVLFRSHNDDAILTDFGIARNMQAESQLTQIGSTVGTPKYMSPEQARGLKVDGRADIYSLGIMLYEMLTGRPPFSATDTISLAIKHCQEPVPPLSENLRRYQPLLDRMLAKDVKNRFQNGVEVMNYIENLQKQPTTNNTRAAQPAMGASSMGMASSSAPASVAAPAPAWQTTQRSKVFESRPYQAFYNVEEQVTGGFLFRKYHYTVSFSCDDYEEFTHIRQKMHDQLTEWLKLRGKKAVDLTVNIQAHPWIHARIWEVLSGDQPFDSSYYQFLEQATVTIHIYDELIPEEGKTVVLREKGKVPAEATAKA